MLQLDSVFISSFKSMADGSVRINADLGEINGETLANIQDLNRLKEPLTLILVPTEKYKNAEG